MQLRGFARISLEPGETKAVTFTLSARQFAFWGIDGGWIVEPGKIEFMIGSASDDIRARAAVEVTGNATADQSPASIRTPFRIEDAR